MSDPERPTPAQRLSPIDAASAPADRRRPIITSLNGDNSWLLSFPYPPQPDTPQADATPKPQQKAYYHLVFDPWLVGQAEFISPLFSTFTQPQPAAITSGAGVEDVARQIETAAHYATTVVPPSDSTTTTAGKSPIDAILITIDAPDHLHEPSLRTFDPSIPVFCTDKVAAIVKRWGFFDTVIETSDYDPSSFVDSGNGDECEDPDGWRRLHPDAGGLPSWLSIFRVRGNTFLNFSTAVVYSSPSNYGEKHEALLFVPHGIKPEAPAIHAFLKEWGGETKGSSKSVLALFHALHESYVLGMSAAYGVLGGLAVERLARPRYWVKSHHALLLPGGPLAWIAWLKDVARTLSWGLEQEKKSSKGAPERSGEPNVVEVENGGCFVLE